MVSGAAGRRSGEAEGRDFREINSNKVMFPKNSDLKRPRRSRTFCSFSFGCVLGSALIVTHFCNQNTETLCRCVKKNNKPRFPPKNPPTNVTYTGIRNYMRNIPGTTIIHLYGTFHVTDLVPKLFIPLYCSSYYPS